MEKNYFLTPSGYGEKGHFYIFSLFIFYLFLSICQNMLPSSTGCVFVSLLWYCLCRASLNQLRPIQMAFWAKTYVTSLTRAAHWMTLWRAAHWMAYC